MRYIGYQRLRMANVSFSRALSFNDLLTVRPVKGKAPVHAEEEDEEEELRKLQAEMAM
jgi:hypothetical protein